MARPRRHRSDLTPARIEELKRKDWNQSQIAEAYGLTRQAVSIKKIRHGRYSMTPRERVMKEYPWKVPAAFRDTSPDKRMRDHAEYIATQGHGMSKDKLKRLASFYRKLQRENVVVEFNPNIPPSPGIKKGGWRFAPREDSDGDLIIRVNEYTNLTEDGRMLWRFPPRFPEVD